MDTTEKQLGYNRPSSDWGRIGLFFFSRHARIHNLTERKRPIAGQGQSVLGQLASIFYWDEFSIWFDEECPLVQCPQWGYPKMDDL